MQLNGPIAKTSAFLSLKVNKQPVSSLFDVLYSVAKPLLRLGSTSTMTVFLFIAARRSPKMREHVICFVQL